MQRMFPVRSRERITSWDNLNRYLAALSPSPAAGQGSARGLSLPAVLFVSNKVGSVAAAAGFITALVARANQSAGPVEPEFARVRTPSISQSHPSRGTVASPLDTGVRHSP